MTSDERLRLAQQRGQARFVWFDRQPVAGTGIATLNERLLKPLISAARAANPATALQNLRLLVRDDGDVVRATVGGILLCTDEPQRWFPNASIMATRYSGSDRASGQFDAQEITGPLHHQIAGAVRFVVRNMRVAARKVPGRVDMPQYSIEAVFEAVVNAVAHRDYSVRGQRIRLSMFADRLEIDSPCCLPNGMTIENMEVSQSTRNDVIVSVFGRLSVGDIPGSENRQFLMERRGDGVAAILRRTRETAGRDPVYRLNRRVQPGAGNPGGVPRHSSRQCGCLGPLRRKPLARRGRPGPVSEQHLEAGSDRRVRRNRRRSVHDTTGDARVRSGYRTPRTCGTGVASESARLNSGAP